MSGLLGKEPGVEPRYASGFSLPRDKVEYGAGKIVRPARRRIDLQVVELTELMDAPQLGPGKVLKAVSPRQLPRLEYGTIAVDTDEVGSMPLKGVDVGGHAVAIEKHKIKHEIVPIIRNQPNSTRKALLHLVPDWATANAHDRTEVIDVVVEFKSVSGTGLHANVGLRQHLEHRVGAEMQEGTRPTELKRTCQGGLAAAGGTVQEHDHGVQLAAQRPAVERRGERGTRPSFAGRRPGRSNPWLDCVER